MNEKLLIGVVGTNGSGKSTVCEYLSQKGFLIVSLSDIIRDYVATKNLSPDRRTLTECANKLKQEYGLNYCAKQTYEKVVQSEKKNAVFDSIRHPVEVEFLKGKQVILIGIETTLQKRYERIQKRKRQTDFVTFETFKAQDEAESSGSSYGQSISKCLELCDHKILNNSTLEELYKKNKFN